MTQVALLGGIPGATALGETYQVGPGRQYEDLEPLMRDVLQAGDVVEVDGDATYPGELVMWGGNWEGAATGTAEAPVTLRGIRKNGKRPVISRGENWGIVLYMNHTIFEGFEVEGGAMAAIVHKADHVTIRDVLVRDCPAHGILGTDSESGSLTMQYVEVTRCGEGDSRHSIYIAGDELMYPGHVFRMEHSFVHDSNGGNSVKSRAERNEIYANWIEGSIYHELDLIGPADPAVEGLAREDSDIVGNVLVKHSGQTFACLRAGGDGNLSTDGRYRFVNNTCVLPEDGRAPFFLQYGIESLELHNNAFVGGGPDASLAILVDGADPAIEGSHNYLSDTIASAKNDGTPITLESTLQGGDPGFEDLSAYDLRITAESPLKDMGADPVPDSVDHPFPNPLPRPTYLPPQRQIQAVGAAVLRSPLPVLDIGAFEVGAPTPPDPSTGGNGAGGETGDDGGATDGDDEGCGCEVGTSPARGALPFGLGVLAAVRLLRRRDKGRVR